MGDFVVPVAISAAFVAAGFVKGVVGMGLPIVAMAVLSLFLAPAAAAAMLVVPSLVTNVWQLMAGPALGRLVRRLATMLVGVALGTLLTIDVLTARSGYTSAALGAILVSYGLFGLFAPQFTVAPRAEPWLSPVIGLLTGLLTGVTGVFGMPAVPYLSSLGLATEDLIQALGLSFTVSTVALAVGLMVGGQFGLSVALSSLLAVIPALLGMLIGSRVRSKMQPETFRRWFLVGLVLLGIYTLLRALQASNN